jgi:hypothetical protein
MAHKRLLVGPQHNMALVNASFAFRNPRIAGHHSDHRLDQFEQGQQGRRSLAEEADRQDV